MFRGTVKAIKAGYGFLTLEDGRDVFFLPTHLKDSSVLFEDLVPGRSHVECDVIEKEAGKWRATRVLVV